jgi:hypothetical protein
VTTTRHIVPRVWGAFASDVLRYTGHDVERHLRDRGWPLGTPWRLVRTAGYFQRGMPMLFDAIGPTPIPGVFWHGEKSQPSTATWDRWDGFRYMGLGVVVPPDYPWPHGAPWRRVYSPDGQVLEQMLMIEQYAAAEGCAAYALVVWDFTRNRPVYDIRTIGRPVTAHEDKLARKAQHLIAELSMRGRPVELPIQARERLLRGALELKRGYWDISREGLSRVVPGCNSVDGVADLLDRAMWDLEDLAEAANKTHTARKRGR